MGPISGMLSDKYGPRWIATLGMVVNSIAFLLLAALPYNFSYLEFASVLFLLGMGGGMFASPNSASIMNSVPAQDRGVASGMMYTIMNTAFTTSMAIFFTIVIVGITQRFPEAMTASLSSIGAVKLAPILSSIPPTGALFSAFLGYNPVNSLLAILPANIVATIPQGTLATLTGTTWFPSTLAVAFMPSLQISFVIGAAFCAIAAVLSALRGENYIHQDKLVEMETSPNVGEEVVQNLDD
ncbi:MAG: MFS transporter, partial [Methanobacterium sp.]